MQLDRTTARALVDAGYMPLSDYVAMFADRPAIDVKPATVLEIGHHRTRQWTVPARFAGPIGRIRVKYKGGQSAA